METRGRVWGLTVFWHGVWVSRVELMRARIKPETHQRSRQSYPIEFGSSGFSKWTELHRHRSIGS